MNPSHPIKPYLWAAFVLLLMFGFWESCHADTLDSHHVTCHRKYWEKGTGKWTYVLCVFPSGRTELYMQVPEHSYSSPIMTPRDMRQQMELASPAVIQIPELKPLPPLDLDDDDDDSSSPKEKQ